VPLFLIKYYAIMAYREWRYGSKLGTRWRRVVQFTRWPLYHRGKNPRYLSDKVLSVSQGRAGRWRELNPGSWAISPPARNKVLVPIPRYPGPPRLWERNLNEHQGQKNRPFAKFQVKYLDRMNTRLKLLFPHDTVYWISIVTRGRYVRAQKKWV
jgi:hypothetical protein